MATIPVRKMTMTAELTRLNQWIRGSNTWRYLSHLVAHAVDEYYTHALEKNKRVGYSPFDTVGVDDLIVDCIGDVYGSITITIRGPLSIKRNLPTRRLNNKPHHPMLISPHRLPSAPSKRP